MNDTYIIEENKKNSSRNRLIVAGLLLIPLVLLDMAGALNGAMGISLPLVISPQEYPLNFEFLKLSLLLLCIFNGKNIIISAIKKPKNAIPNLLCSISVFAAIIESMYSATSAGHSYLLLAGIIIFINLLGQYLYNRAQLQTIHALHQIQRSAPSTARITDIDGEHEIPVAEVKAGDVIVVKAGELIPVDGTITRGIATIDESIFGGGLVPVEKGIGTPVSCMTRNLGDSFQYTAAGNGNDSSLSRIIRLLEMGASPDKKSRNPFIKPLRWMLVTFPALAIVALFYWISQDLPDLAIHSFLTTLILAYPAGAALAAPLAIMSSTEKSMRSGILIKDGNAFELARQTDSVVFDKTGTLTHGNFVVTDVIPEGLSEETLLSLAASAEAECDHPIADAIIERTKSKHIRIQRMAAYNHVPMQGIEALINGKALRVGKADWLEEQGSSISAELKTKGDQLAGKGKTVVYISTGILCRGLIALGNPPVREAKSAIRTLQDMDINVSLLSGDSRTTVKAISKDLGITDYRCNLLPKDKATEIQLQKSRGRVVAMTGDGELDAAALSCADITIATAGSSDKAIENAGIILLRGDLTDIPRAFQLCRNTLKQLHSNLYRSMFWSIILLPIALGGLSGFGILLNPWLVFIALALSILSVVFFSLLKNR